MNNKTPLKDDLQLQQIALACLDYWNKEICAPDQRSICYSWVARRYAAMFGGSFHQSQLARLERLGFLAKDGDTSRGGDRRYYRITNPRGWRKF
jgi:hypothetical protein